MNIKKNPQNNSRMLSLSFLKSHRKEGGALLRSFVFITEGEVLTAERLLSSAFGLTSSFCLDKLDWEPSYSESARENITRNAEPFLHFSEQQKGITDLSPPIQFPPAGCNKPSRAAALRRDLLTCVYPPTSPLPTQTPLFYCGEHTLLLPAELQEKRHMCEAHTV